MILYSSLCKFPLRFAAATALLLAAALPQAVAGDAASSAAGAASAIAAPSTRYGLFNLLDHRSSYGQGVFPEPFLVDDSDLEQGELRADWLHTQNHGARSDFFRGELEKGFGNLTLELEVPFERDSSHGVVTEGASNVNLGARYPLLQLVAPSGNVDTTFGAAFEAGIPTHSSMSKNGELVPKIFNDLRAGDFTVQSVLGYSVLTGPGEAGGLQNFEYGFVFGYTIGHDKLAIPGVEQVIPIFEISGEKTLNKSEAGRNSVLGNIALRVNTKAIGSVQPRLGMGFVFPINDAARQETHWGIVTSLVFEY